MYLYIEGESAVGYRTPQTCSFKKQDQAKWILSCIVNVVLLSSHALAYRDDVYICQNLVALFAFFVALFLHLPNLRTNAQERDDIRECG